VDVNRILEEDLLVDFVREKHQVIAPRQVRELFKDMPRINGAGRVVGVDDDDGPSLVGNFCLDVGHVRPPVVLLVAGVVHGFAAAEHDRCGPQRVVGGGNEDLVSGFEESLERHGDEFTHAITHENIFHADLHQAFGLVMLGDRGSR
jgi:hypothetical protein